MKIVHVSHGFLPECSGGVEFYLRELLSAQQEVGHEVALISGCLEVQPKCGYEEVTVEGLRVLRLWRDDWYHDHYARAWHPEIGGLFADLLRMEKPDVLHVHQWIRLSNDLVRVARSLGIRTVVTLHDVYTSCPRAFRMHRNGEVCFRELSVASCLTCVPRFGHEEDDEVRESIELFAANYREELLAADRVFVALQGTADLLAESSALPASIFTVNGLGYRRRLTAAPAWSEPTDVLRIGHWGSLVPHKGVVVLLDALRQLQGEGTRIPVQLELFGPVPDPHFESVLRERANGLPVTFHGRYDLEQIAAAGLHLGVFPSTCIETYGLVLAECFELGLPAIVSDLGALPERAGQAAWRVRAADVAHLAATLRRAAAQPEDLQGLRAAIPALPPLPEEHAASLLAAYQDVLARPGAEQAAPSAGPLAVRQRALAAGQQASMTASYADPRQPPQPH